MENHDQSIITISGDTNIEKPADRDMFPVEKIDWKRLRGLIKRINFKNNRWENAGWFMAAISIAFFIASFTLPTGKDIYITYFFIASGFSLIITLILFFISWTFSKLNQNSKNEALNEMDQMETKTIKAKDDEELEIMAENFKYLKDN
ncbi:hypothetical protein D4R42_03665 [bacterium]|nr:MAG: hypothetical protein D4R42_03665 [bacterium]